MQMEATTCVEHILRRLHETNATPSGEASSSTSNGAEQFLRDGFVVLTDGLPSAFAQQLHDEIMDAHFHRKDTSPNKVQFLLKSGAVEVTKPCIFECDLHQPTLRSRYPGFRSFFEGGLAASLAQSFNRAFEPMDMALTAAAASTPAAETRDSDATADVAKHITLKMQVNLGGAFPWHYDNPAPPNKRKLTMAVYLTKTWHEGDGGELQLWPFLAAQPTTIPPLFNTVVLFRSDLVLHRVAKRSNAAAAGLPPRLCFTIWFDSSSVNADADVNLRAKHLTESFIPNLKASPLQRSLSRLVYDQEYIESLGDTFQPGTKDYAISLRIHEGHCAALKANPTLLAFAQSLRGDGASKPR